MYVKQLPSGKYRWIVQHRGQRRSGSAKDRGSAILAGAVALIALGADRSTSELTVGDLLEAWQAENRHIWSPTYAADIATVAAKLPAEFTARPIDSVTPPVVATFYRQLEHDGWSPHRIGRVHIAISRSFGLAVKYGWVDDNPARDLRAPRLAPARIQVPDRDTLRALERAAPKKLKLIVRLAVATGARLGELVALRWDDLDGADLNIRRAVIYTPASGVQVRDTVKTGRKGERRLELDERTVAMLHDLHAEETATAEAAMLPAPVYVFSHDRGVTPWRPGYVGLEFRRLRRKVPGADRVRFHDLRHYVATSMLADGEEPIDVAAQLGHATPATTFRVYAHYLPGRGGEATRRRVALFDDDD